MDGKALCTEKYQYVPRRSNLQIYLHTLITTSKLLPLDARIFAFVKVNYRSRHFERELNLNDVAINEI